MHFSPASSAWCDVEACWCDFTGTVSPAQALNARVARDEFLPGTAVTVQGPRGRGGTGRPNPIWPSHTRPPSNLYYRVVHGLIGGPNCRQAAYRDDFEHHPVAEQSEDEEDEEQCDQAAPPQEDLLDVLASMRTANFSKLGGVRL